MKTKGSETAAVRRGLHLVLMAPGPVHVHQDALRFVRDAARDLLLDSTREVSSCMKGHGRAQARRRWGPFAG
jgi:hypothetical protein